MGFSDVDSVPAAHAVTLTAEQIEAGEPIVLKLAKFSNGEAFGGGLRRLGDCAVEGLRGREQMVWGCPRGPRRPL
jgi:hypothetical protein